MTFAIPCSALIIWAKKSLRWDWSICCIHVFPWKDWMNERNFLWRWTEEMILALGGLFKQRVWSQRSRVRIPLKSPEFLQVYTRLLLNFSTRWEDHFSSSSSKPHFTNKFFHSVIKLLRVFSLGCFGVDVNEKLPRKWYVRKLTEIKKHKFYNPISVSMSDNDNKLK